MVKNPPSNAGNRGDVSSVPGWGRSPGGGNGNTLQYSYLENPWTEEPGGLQSTGLQRAGHDLVTEHACIIEIQTWISGSLLPLSYHTFINLSGGPANLPFSLSSLYPHSSSLRMAPTLF